MALDVIVAGAGGSGLKVLEILEQAPQDFGTELKLIGFVDDDESLWETEFFGYPIFGSPAKVLEMAKRKTVGLACPIGDPVNRKKCIQKMDGSEVVFPNVVHPSALISKHASLGQGNIFSQNTVVQAGVTIGNFNTFNMAATVGPLATIHDYCTINSHVMMASGSETNCFAYIGMGATVKQRVCVGEGTVLGANAFLGKDSEAWSIMVGVPAKLLRQNTSPFER